MAKYINLLTDKEIECFFNNNGYKLIKDLYDSEGFPIRAIERTDDNIFVRAQQIDKSNLETEIEELLTQNAPMFRALSMLASMRSAYGRNIDLIHFSDYFMSKICILDEDQKASEELCNSYIEYMIEKFPNYKKDLIEYCNSLPDDESDNEDSM